MKTLLLPLIAALTLTVRAAPPVVSNVRASQIAGTKNVEILYDVSDADGDALTIAMQVSGDAGQTYSIPATALSGNIRAGVAPGTNRRIVWNAGADWNSQLVTQAKVRVTASDATTPAPPPGMVYIPAGIFQMGDNFNEAGPDTLPVHNVNVSGFSMDRFEVTKELWQPIQIWASGHGYNISNGSFAGSGHPVQSITWYDALKWCNARSEKDGLSPCYYTDTAQTLIYKIGSIAVTNATVKWTANGYRLPTEAEWEKAARGGSMALRFPWGNSIEGSQANYYQSGDPFGNLFTQTTPAGYYNGSQTPTGVDMANGYGLYDVTGNVWEWCWDWYASTYYGDVTANSDPHGPTSGPWRVHRGGSFGNATEFLRCAQRGSTYSPDSTNYDIGFRCVRGL